MMIHWSACTYAQADRAMYNFAKICNVEALPVLIRGNPFSSDQGRHVHRQTRT